MSSRGPPSTSVGSASEYIRASDEYTVAFDLEIWKAQQQAKFRQQLRQAKESLEKKVLQELKAAHTRKAEELEGRRHELEQMAQRVQAAGEALAKRSDQFQQREQAFEARRVRVAEQHEAHLQRVEMRAKQSTESLTVQLHTAHGELSEKDGIIRDLRSKLLAAENEYDGLLRTLARTRGGDEAATDASDTHATRPGADPATRALEAELHAAKQTIQARETLLAQQQAEIERLTRESACQAQALRKAESRVDELGRKCARVQDDYYAREREHLQMERDQLDAQKREERRTRRHTHLLAAVGLQAGSASFPRSLHTGSGLSSLSTTAATAAPSTRRGRDDDGLHDMLQALRSDIQHALTTSTTRSPHESSRLAPAHYVVAEQPSKRGSVLDTSLPLTRNDEAASIATTTASADGHARALRDAAVQANSPASLHADHGDGADAGEHSGDDIDVEDEDEDDAVYEHVAVESWMPESRVSGLPPLSPSYAKDDAAHAGATPSASAAPATTNAHMTLPPEDFARAVGSLPGGDASTTRVDMQTFVQQMKINRQKLLETGVYTESHPVIREMSEKIHIYEDFLDSQLS